MQLNLGENMKKVVLYRDLKSLFEDKVISPTEIIVFFGKRGRGKSSVMGWFESQFMKPEIAKERIELSKMKCEKLRQADIYITPPEDHLVFIDTYFEDNGFRGEKRRPYNFKGTDFVLPNETHKASMPVVPFASIFLDEVQDLYDSHIGAVQPFVSKAFELSRQAGLFIGMACQRPIRIVKDIRELAIFAEVVGHEEMYIRGEVIATIWTLNLIYENSDLERYLDTRDKQYIDRTIQIMFKGNIYSCYDPDYFFPMFYRGFENQMFVFEKVEKTDFSVSGMKKYNENRLIDIPETFRGKKEKKKKETVEK